MVTLLLVLLGTRDGAVATFDRPSAGRLEPVAAASQVEPHKARPPNGPAAVEGDAMERAVPGRPALLDPLKRLLSYGTVGPQRTSMGSVLEGKQILTYYGNPYTAQMGVLGAYDPETALDLLAEHARVYDSLNGSTGVLPAVQLVYAVAQGEPTDNQLYLQYVADQDLARYVELTRERGMLLILDIQIGRSSAEVEVEKLVPYLRLPHVSLALDPEFAVAPGEVPGVNIGRLDAEDINRVQARLQNLVLENDLPPKVLIVHQFLDSMITNSEAIAHYPGVDLVIDMDGFGPSEVKQASYSQFAGRDYARYAGIKLFFQHDPDLMPEQRVLALTPRPSVVIYQ